MDKLEIYCYFERRRQRDCEKERKEAGQAKQPKNEAKARMRAELLKMTINAGREAEKGETLLY